mgnify:CR=1 FL=1
MAAKFGQRHVQNRTIQKGDTFALLVEDSGPGAMFTELGRSCVLKPYRDKRTVELLEYFAGRPGMHSLAAVQEARVRGGAAVLPRMTAAFALGQIVGPVLANALGHLPGLDATTAMNLALQIAAASLLASADAAKGEATFKKCASCHTINQGGANGIGPNLFGIVGKYLPEQPWWYAEDELTDRSEKFLASETVREKLFRFTGEELPYTSTVVIEKFDEEPSPRHGRMVRIAATIVVERDSHKAMVIGDKGERLKRIGTEARQELEKLMDAKVFLEIWVKVRTGWADDEARVRSFGYE